MNLLQYLVHALSAGQAAQQPRQIPQSQPIIGRAQVPYSQATADAYNANPQAFVGKNAIDPKYFGYPADNLAVPVQHNFGMQGFGQGQEDDYSPLDALTQRSYDNGQVSLHGRVQQGSLGNPNAQRLQVLNQLYQRLFR